MNGTFRQNLLKLPGFSRLAAALILISVVGVFALVQSRESVAQVAPVDLGTAASFSVLAGSRVTNTGPSIISRDLGVWPGTAITGFPPGIVQGAQHSADAVALQAQSDLTTAYEDAAGRTPPTSIAGDLGGRTLPHGIYASSSSIGLTGPLTLDGEGDPNAVFIFQITSTLITASGSSINLINNARACNVFWQVGSSATLGTNSTFVGNILALASISATTGTTINGRLLARNGQVSLDTNTVNTDDCPTTTPPVTTPPVTTPPSTKKPIKPTKKPIKPAPCSYDHGHHEHCHKAPCYAGSPYGHGLHEPCYKMPCYSESSADHGYREACYKEMCHSESSYDHGLHEPCYKTPCYPESCDGDATHEPCYEQPCFGKVKYRLAGAQRLALAPAPRLVKKNLRVTG